MCGRIANGSQAANAMALYMGLLEPGEENRVLDYLVRDIQMRSYHTTAGDVGHPYVVGALIKYDRNNIMYQMMLQTDYPSYGAQALLGATTMGEDWAGADPGQPAISQNHFMLGAAEQWFYEGLAGIRYGQDGRDAENCGSSLISRRIWSGYRRAIRLSAERYRFSGRGKKLQLSFRLSSRQI